MIKELFEREKSSKKFGVLDIYYLVFVAEELKNF